MDPSVGLRLREYRTSKRMKQLELAQATGVKQTTLSSIETGVSSPSAVILQKILAGCPDLSPSWLMNGEGPMYKDGRALTPTEAPARQSHLTAERGGLSDVVPRSTYDEVARQLNWLQQQYDKLLAELLGKPLSDCQTAFAPAPLPKVGFQQAATMRRSVDNRAVAA